MNTIEITSVAQFHEQIQTTHEFHPLFRGESKATYELLCKFGRHAKRNPKNTISLEMAALMEFKRLALPHISYEPSNNWEWIALAQHYGLATRLLDWTKNPLVAAYFALEKPYMEDAVIYVFNEYSLDFSDLNTDPFKATKNTIYRPRHTASRMSSQAGVFTSHADPIEIFSNETLERWVLKKEMLLDLMTTLHVYGVNKNFIFPGLDSVCEDIHKKYIW